MRSTGALGAAGWLALTLVSGPAALAQSEPPATPPLPAAHRPEITLDLREPEGGTFTGDLAVLEVVVVTRHPYSRAAWTAALPHPVPISSR